MLPWEQMEKLSSFDDTAVALEKLTAQNIHQLPMVEDNRVTGILRRNDILHHLQLHTDLKPQEE